SLDYQDLDLDTETIKFIYPLDIKAFVVKIKNAVSVDVEVKSKFHTYCSRCLKDLEIDLHKQLKFNYMLEKNQEFLNIDEDIREALILDYPVKPLCKPQCLGLCLRCGKDLNEGPCNCKKEN
ncbi:MAG: DUF177 domain-containing protein, partial [Candidatus Omnitrophica bacterium]|nr:DUF177 domain-containing protein [Candidatus Omnitrophota bacterium]